MIDKITIGIVGNQYSNGGNQPLISIDSPFNLLAGRPFDTNINASFYVEIRHTSEFVSYVFNLRPSLVHSVGAIREGVFWIAMTIPTGMNVCDRNGVFVSPMDILNQVFSIFSENYMQKRGDGSYEFKDGTCFRAPVDAYIDSLTLVRNPYISYIPMNNNGSTCYLSMDRENMRLFLRDTQYPELSNYNSVIVAESVFSQTPFNSPVPRPLFVDVKYGARLLGQINYYGKQYFECVVEPSNTDTHDNVSVRFSLDDLKNSSEEYRGYNFTARRQSSYISVEPVFPEKKRFIKINSDDFMWKGSYIENGSDRIYAQLSESAYGFFLSVDQFSGEWTLHLAPSSEFCDVVWQFAIEGDIATPKCPRLVSEKIIAIDGKIKEKIIAAHKSTIAPIRNTASSNAPKTPEIPDNEADVILDCDNVKFIKDNDPDARLTLSYGSEIIYSVEAKELSGIWRLKDPYNPHLIEYRLKIESKKHKFIPQKATEGLPKHIISVDDCVTSENDKSENIGLLNHVLDEMKKLPILKMLIPISVVLVLGIMLGLRFYIKEPPKIEWDKFFRFEVPFFNKSKKSNPVPKKQGDTTIAEKIDSTIQEFNVDEFLKCAQDLNYRGNDLRLSDLDSLRSILKSASGLNNVKKEKINSLLNIYDEIIRIQDGYYKSYNIVWKAYINPATNVLRNNATKLQFINGKQTNLYKALEPYFGLDGKNSTMLKDFQQKYIQFGDTDITPEQSDINSLKCVKSFKGLRKLYEDYKNPMPNNNL